MSRDLLVNVFNDTASFIRENKVLNEAVNYTKSNTHLYLDGHSFNNFNNITKRTYLNNVFVTKHKTFEAAVELHKVYPNARIAVLNFASATNPGGGVTSGSSAQEESLCRCSTLYPCLSNKYLFNEFYNNHRNARDPLHNNDLIYSPDVIICKDEDYNRLPESKFVKVDVISCAAPNLKEKPNNQYNSYYNKFDAANITDDELYQIHLSRAKHILLSAYTEGARVLVLGAFGCGVFKNNPRIVAKAYKDALQEYGRFFTEIEFAVYCKGYETQNYDIFKEILE